MIKPIRFVLGPVLCALILASINRPASAKPVPDNLGNGLDKIVESNLILKGNTPAPVSDTSAKANGTAMVAGKSIATYDGYATRQAANYAAHAIIDPASKQLLVDIHLSGSLPFADVQKALTAKFASLKITAVDAKYRGAGVIEGFVSVDDVVALSQTNGVRSVQLSLKPYHHRPAAPPRGPVTPAAAGPLWSDWHYVRSGRHPTSR